MPPPPPPPTTTTTTTTTNMEYNVEIFSVYDDILGSMVSH